MKDLKSNTGLKEQAGYRAAELVESGMIVGLGTGSTTAFAIEHIGKRIREEGIQIRAVATSFQSMNLAISSGIIIEPVEAFSSLDISIDGADEIDSSLHLIKGGGAAHSREKLVHAMSSRFIVIADKSKQVYRLGQGFPVPVEILPSACKWLSEKLKQIGATEVSLRTGSGKDGPLVTDNGNLILDCRFPDLHHPSKMETEINQLPGVLDNGIFALYRPDQAIIATDEGVEILG